MAWESTVGRLRGLNPLVVDGLFALLLTALGVAGLYAVEEHLPGIDFKEPDALGISLAAMQTLPLAFRRRVPMQVLGASGIATTLFYLAGYETTIGGVGPIVALYTVASICPRRESVGALGVTAVALGISLLAEDTLSVEIILSNYVIFGTAWILGDNIRTRRAYTASLEDRAARLEREREEDARRAAAEERSRIARELHDIVAHNVSVMVVQAGAARRVLESKHGSGQARDALQQIETTGRGALNEMRRMVGMLRKEQEEATFSPQPSISRLRELISQAKDAGLPVELTVEGEPRPLPSGIDLSAYRIVQEALTNTMKHAGRATARVYLRYEPDHVEIQIVDDGRGITGELDNGAKGHGLVGMRERVSLYGGDLVAGPQLGGGYSVKAILPVETTSQ
jgi:signal transduction histidine kinase